MAEVVRPYRGVSAEQRRAQRRAGLIEAALDVLGDEGIAGTTMTAVCARAGLTERYFYESFRDRDELLVAVYAAGVAEVYDVLLRALAASPPDPLARARAVAGALIEVLTSDPRKGRLHAESIGSEALREHRTAAISAIAAVVANQLRDLRGLDDTAHDAPLRLAAVMLVGGLSEAIVGWLDGTLDLSREMLVEECARLAVAAADAVKAATDSSSLDVA
jgi:AcrR family transcriptional regulator